MRKMGKIEKASLFDGKPEPKLTDKARDAKLAKENAKVWDTY